MNISKHPRILAIILALCFSANIHTAGLTTPSSDRQPLPSYDNQPITPNTWEEVDFTYTDDFPYQSAYPHKTITGCEKFINTEGKPVLCCTEHMNLLRPKALVKQWQQEQQHHGWVPITIKEFGINDVHGHITAIKPTHTDTTKINLRARAIRPVIATFERHTLNVRTYTFKDQKTGKLSVVDATPNHKFYVENKKIFESIQDVSPNDQLLSDNGDAIQLICANNQSSHCGKVYDPQKRPVRVYNLEVYRQHRYFVGSDHVLVHNTNCGNDPSVPETIQSLQNNAQKIGTKINNLDELTKGDIFIRSNFYKKMGIMYGHSSFHIYDENLPFFNGLLGTRTIELTGAEDEFLNMLNIDRNEIIIKDNPDFDVINIIIFDGKETYKNSANWISKSTASVYKLNINESDLNMAINAEKEALRANKPMYGPEYNCHTFACNVLKKLS